MPYKKRRIKKSPNKNQERSQRSQASFLPLKSYFPEIERLIVDIRYSSKQGHLLQDDHHEYGPSDPVSFVAPCPGGCGDGTTDLQGKIDSVVRQHESDSRFQARCMQPIYSASEPCGCEIEGKVSVIYRAS